MRTITNSQMRTSHQVEQKDIEQAGVTQQPHLLKPEEDRLPVGCSAFWSRLCRKSEREKADMPSE